MDESNQKIETNEELQALEDFNEKSVEPMNHTRDSLSDDYTLSYL